MSRSTRRKFLKTSLAVAGGTILGRNRATHAGGGEPTPQVVTGVRGANETIRVAVAGVNGRGVAHLDEFTPMPNVKVVAIADPDSRLFGSRLKLIQDKGHNTAKAVQDVRR